MISKEAKEIYVREEVNFLKGAAVNEDLKDSAMATLMDNNLFNEATEDYVKEVQEYSKEVITPLCKKLFHILKNKGNLKKKKKEEVDKLVEDLKEKDKNFLIRSLVLEDFFKLTDLSEPEKIDIALKVGALELDLKYYDKKGYLV